MIDIYIPTCRPSPVYAYDLVPVYAPTICKHPTSSHNGTGINGLSSGVWLVHTQIYKNTYIYATWCVHAIWSVYVDFFHEAGQVANRDLCILTSAHNTFPSDIEAMYLFLISKASYRYFPSHVKHWQSSILNKNDHIWCMSRERNPLYLASILLNSCLRSPSYNTQWNKRWRSSSKTIHNLHSRSCTGIIGLA